MKNLIYLSLLACWMLSCSTEKPQDKNTSLTIDKEKAIAQIDSLRDLYMRAVKEQNRSLLKGLASPEAVTMYPASSDWLQMKREATKAFSYDSLQIVPLEIQIINNEWAYELGYSNCFFTPKDSSSARMIHDTYLLIFRNTGNGFQMYRELASGNMPDDEWIKKANKLGRPYPY
ncbi:hypothetical protein [Marinoscillum sp.]|uniref:hypothetical protein n=1 Tax=Marinoscillum sp. TaxID=2024838 RepID=UPI003BA8B413